MALDPKILSAVLKKREAALRRKESELLARRDRIHRQIPRVADIEAELRGTMVSLARAALSSPSDPASAMAALRDHNLALQGERSDLLQKNGYPADYLNPAPDCAICGDTGYVGSHPCDCLRRECALAQARELSSLLNTGQNNFDTFSLAYYGETVDPAFGTSPRENMEYVYDICWNFALHFGEGPDNLLFTGKPGLGKTFLSGCIAKAVAAAGYAVVYDTAIHVLSLFEKEKFSTPDEETRLGLRRVRECDLLILDDLGTEMPTAFTLSAVYSIVNDRLLASLSTVVSTNLSPDELSGRYGSQTASRLLGDFTVLRFFGEDIRAKKAKERDGLYG